MTRQQILAELKTGNARFDVVIVGGGITGAGAAREAAGSGLRTLLVEQKDFAWGTSSRSSKMVHGGLRYLGSGHIGLTRDAVRERQRMMAEAPGLVEPLRFVMPHYQGQFPGPRLFQALLAVYDRLAGARSRQRLTPSQTQQWAPGLNQAGLLGASLFTDALTDDARLVQRLIAEASQDGALCLNYVSATRIIRNEAGMVNGLVVVPEGEPPESGITVSAPIVINATGAWADRLQQQGPSEQPLSIRPLRGSHLVVPWKRLPVTCAVSLFHPEDKRPVFAFPWAGTTVLGTTDLDHRENLDQEPVITDHELRYLLQVAEHLFPGASLSARDVISTWAGVRPVVTDGQGKTPSRENREHALRQDKGLISVAGGKLTTFRQIAREALEAALEPDGSHRLRADDQPVFQPLANLDRPTAVRHLTWQRLKGYYGPALAELCRDADFTEVADTGVLWAELEWACRQEQVHHLDDLLLRRTRLGLVCPAGARTLLPELQKRCQRLLDWTDERWQREVERYLSLYQQAYALPSEGG
ncbi:glycerol-3-phosphate dehydrogenase/oxidase [Marinobacter sp. NSM]|uniref:glycerol-3-phosphate dehydrogenase/oxidase n=1 Tax=Marinobacter sp. NSM TaxID=3458004 RepID=UPI004034FC26